MTTEIKPARKRVTAFADGNGYIYMDGFDKCVALALVLGALVLLGVTIWEWMQ